MDLFPAHWAHYEDWEAMVHAKLAKEKCGLQTVDGFSEVTFTFLCATWWCFAGFTCIGDDYKIWVWKNNICYGDRDKSRADVKRRRCKTRKKTWWYIPRKIYCRFSGLFWDRSRQVGTKVIHPPWEVIPCRSKNDHRGYSSTFLGNSHFPCINMLRSQSWWRILQLQGPQHREHTKWHPMQ